MNTSTMNKRNTASERSGIGRVNFKNRLNIILSSALLLAATNAVAGILFVPIGDKYINPELATVSIQDNGAGSAAVRTTGLTGEATIRGSDFPPEYDIATTAKLVLPFEQELELVVDIAEGTISGRAVTRYADEASTCLAATSEVRGHASCLPFNGNECGRWVVDLELRGVVSNPNDPSIVGQLRTKMLGSVIAYGDEQGVWAALSANTTIGGNEGLISSLTSMTEGESCGV